MEEIHRMLLITAGHAPRTELQQSWSQVAEHKLFLNGRMRRFPLGTKISREALVLLVQPLQGAAFKVVSRTT